MSPFGPPGIEGISQRAGEESPLDGMLKRLNAKPRASVQLVREAIELLRKAVRVDPNIEPIVGPALSMLTRRDDDDEDSDREREDEPMRSFRASRERDHGPGG